MTSKPFLEYLEPTSHILIWSGDVSNIPAGWQLCDGTNGTPNLLDRFIMGTPDSGTDSGTNNGTDSYTLSESQLPSHSHSASTNTTGGHNHTVGTVNYYSKIISDKIDNNMEEEQSSIDDITYPYRSTGGAGGHNHSVDGVNSAGGNSSIDNRPSYYELAFIQRV